MKKGLYIIGLVIFLSCGEREHNESEKVESQPAKVALSDPENKNELQISGLLADHIVLTDSIEFETETLKDIILKNDALLGIPENNDQMKASNDSFRLQLYRSSRYRVLANKSCNTYKHVYILKEREKRGMKEQFLKPGQKPYSGLYLVILDSKNREIKTTAISEIMNYMGMTPLKGITKANLERDSVLTIIHVSKTCTDIAPSKCITLTREQVYKLRCSELLVIKADTTINWED